MNQQSTFQQSELPETSTTATGEAVVFFDGVCGLCNWTVTFLMDRDREHVLRFAPLQGETAGRLLSPEDQDLNSIVFLREGRTWRRSSAVVRIFRTLPPPWRFLGSILWLVPKPIRDVGYFVVARFRYRLFGKHETCRMPTAADRARMLE